MFPAYGQFLSADHDKGIADKRVDMLQIDTETTMYA